LHFWIWNKKLRIREQLENERYNFEDTWNVKWDTRHEKVVPRILEQKAEKREIPPEQKAQDGQIPP
jgi:hypothetical protein